MKTIQAAGKEVSLYNFTGVVAESGKNLETVVSGGGGGGYSYNGTGGSAPVTIRSHTIVHDQLFLVDKNGNEKSFQLQDFNIACRKDNKLSVIWGIKKGAETGPYIIVHNYTTKETFYRDSSIAKLLRPNQLLLWIGLILGTIIAWKIIGATALVLVIAAIIVLNIRFKQQVKNFKNSISYAEFE